MDPEFEREPSRTRPAPALREQAPQHRRTGLEQTASGVGNRNFTRLVARMQDGDGILPDGIVHPDVERAIAASRGSGAQLDGDVARNVGDALGDSLADVRVHTDEHAAALARAVSARAFTVGNDIFFGAGEYDPRTEAGSELIAHEAAHVVQQRGAPLGGPLMVSQPGDAMEREAEALARVVAG